MTTRTVLLVENNDEDRDIYVTYLRHHGYRVLEAADGAEGVRAAREHRPHLVLMDMMLPGLDGWEATERLKGDPETARIPVVALTVRAMEEDQERARACGCDGYLTKPVDPRVVLEEVRRIIGPAEAPPAP